MSRSRSALSNIVFHLRSAKFIQGARPVGSLSRLVNCTSFSLRKLSEKPRIVTNGRLAAHWRQRAPFHSAGRAQHVPNHE